METSNNSPGLARVTPFIVRGDLAHYRFLANTADTETLRVLVHVMAADLEEALEVACPQAKDSDSQSG
jgi:hypothetical protein